MNLAPEQTNIINELAALGMAERIEIADMELQIATIHDSFGDINNRTDNKADNKESTA